MKMLKEKVDFLKEKYLYGLFRCKFLPLNVKSKMKISTFYKSFPLTKLYFISFSPSFIFFSKSKRIIINNQIGTDQYYFILRNEEEEKNK
jgi:hypothetical protein